MDCLEMRYNAWHLYGGKEIGMIEVFSYIPQGRGVYWIEGVDFYHGD